MRTAFEARASTILYNLVSTLPTSAGVYLLPANICPVVPLALIAAGRPFEFIDLDPASLCMSPSLLCQRLTARDQQHVAGMLFARTYGVDFDASPLFHELKVLLPDLLIIDDRCAASPEPNTVRLNWQGADCVLFSTGYAKQVDLGFGGFAHLCDHVPYSTHHGLHPLIETQR